MTKTFTAALLAATAMGTLAVPVAAATTTHRHHTVVKRVTTTSHDAELRALIAQQQAKIDELSAKVAAMGAAPATAEPSAEELAAREDAAANSEFLKAQVDSLQSQLTDVKAQTAANAPTWSGSPQWKGSGFSFKPSGEIQYDAGYTANPGNRIPATGSTNQLGFNNRARRLLIGASGDLPGDFKYSFQFNFAQSVIDYEDVVLSWEPKNKPVAVTIGYFYPYNGLDNLTSNRFLSVTERTSIYDAFNEGRRLGAGLTYTHGDFRGSLGIFANAINNTNYDNNDYEVAGRLLYAPQALGGQLHFAVNAQYRHFRNTSLASTYRARPLTQTTDVRFISTGNIAGDSDEILGFEALGIFGPFHVQGEAQVLHINAYRPGTAVGNGLSNGEAFPAGSLLPASNPTFWGAYVDAGYWLTGETRGYKNGKIDRTKILNGFDKGGWGGFEITGRAEYINLRDTVGGRTNIGTQLINGDINGGRQLGLTAALNWWPIDYVRFTAQYIHTEVEGGPYAGVVKPLDTRAITDRRYHTDGAVVRAQVDF